MISIFLAPVFAIAAATSALTEWSKVAKILDKKLNEKPGIGLVLSIERPDGETVICNYQERGYSRAGWALKLVPVDAQSGKELPSQGRGIMRPNNHAINDEKVKLTLHASINVEKIKISFQTKYNGNQDGIVSIPQVGETEKVIFIYLPDLK